MRAETLCCYRLQSILSLSLLTLLFLQGCAVSPPQTDYDKWQSWQLYQQQAGKLTDWKLAARMAVRLEADAWSASVYWQQHADDIEVRIVAPLGQGTVMIRGMAGDITILTEDNVELDQAEVEQLMLRNLGWVVPVNALQYWVRGLPEPAAAIQGLELDNGGRPVGFSQTGWSVSYEEFTRTGGYQLPSRLNLHRPGLTVRLRINHWDPAL